MAVPTIDGSNTYASSSNATSHTVPLPATGMAEGKLLVAILSVDTANPTITSTGWTVEGNGDEQWGSSSAAVVRLAWKYAGASESDPVFACGGVSMPMAAWIAVIGGAHATSAIEATASEDNNDTTTNTSVVVPSVTTLGDDRLLLRWAAKPDLNGFTWDSESSEIAELFSSGTIRSLSPASATQATAGATPTSTCQIPTARQFVGGVVAIAAAGPPADTLVPVAGGATTNLETYDHTQIDDNPHSPDADWLTGTDPSGVSPNITLVASANGPNNTTTSTTITIPATVNDNDILVVHAVNAGATAAGSIADNSGVGSWATVKQQAGTAMGGSVWWKRITNQATERSKVITVSGMTDSITGILHVWRGCVTSGSPIDGTTDNTHWRGENNASGDNTMAGITTLTDGARVCLAVFYSDNTAATSGYSATSPATLTEDLEANNAGGLDSGVATASAVKATAGETGNISWSPGTNQISVSIAYALKPHSVTAQTINTEVRAPMSDPTATLATGAGTGTIKALVRKLGDGSDPQARVELRNAAGTLLATPIANTTVSATGGVVLSNTFNQADVGAGTDVVVWVVGTGASGGLIEVGAIRWIAQTSAGAPAQTLVGGGVISGAVCGGGSLATVVSLLGGGLPDEELVGGGTLSQVIPAQTLTGGAAPAENRTGGGLLALTAALSGGAIPSPALAGSGFLQTLISLTGGGEDSEARAGGGALIIPQVLAGGAIASEAFPASPAGTLVLGPAVLVGGAAPSQALSGAGTLTLGALALTGGAVRSEALAGGGALSLGAQALLGGAVASEGRTGAGTLALGALALLGGAVASQALAGGGSLFIGQGMAGGGVPSEGKAGAGALNLGALSLAGGAVPSEGRVGAGVLSSSVSLLGGGALTVQLPGGGTLTLTAPSLVGGGVPSAATLGGGALATLIALSGGGVRSEARLGGGALSLGAQSLIGGGLEAPAVAGAGALVLGAVSLAGGAVSAERLAGGGALVLLYTLSGGGGASVTEARTPTPGGTLVIGVPELLGGGVPSQALAGGGEMLFARLALYQLEISVRMALGLAIEPENALALAIVPQSALGLAIEPDAARELVLDPDSALGIELIAE